MKQQSISKQSRQHERSRTRNQRKRELRRLTCMVFALCMLWLMVFSMMVKAWAEHPAEQPVSGYEYMESIQEGVVVHVFPHR